MKSITAACLSTSLLFCSSHMLAAQGAQGTDLEARRARFREAIAAQWQYELKTNPELATYVGDPRYNDRLRDLSPEAIAADDAENKRQLALFTAIDSTGFSAEELLNKELMIRSLRQAVSDAQLKEWEMPADQMNGIHLSLAALPSAMPFNTAKDYENYLARLHAIPHVLAQATELMRMGLRDRLMPPRYLLDKVGEQAQGIADDKPEQSPFAQPIDKVSRGDFIRRPAAAARGNSHRHREASEPGLRDLCAICEAGLCAPRAHRLRSMGTAQWRRDVPGGGEEPHHYQPHSRAKFTKWVCSRWLKLKRKC